MATIGPLQLPSRELYRLETSPQGDRLVPVEAEAEATHVGLRRAQERLATAAARLTAAQAQMHQQEALIRTLQAEMSERDQRLQEADMQARRLDQERAVHAQALRRLREKNAAIIGEKRRLRDMLSQRVAIPDIYRRIIINYHTGEAFGIEGVSLDTAPDWDQARTALAEARRLATQCGARLKEVRLDRVVWRAVIAISIDAPPPLAPRHPH